MKFPLAPPAIIAVCVILEGVASSALTMVSRDVSVRESHVARLSRRKRGEKDLFVSIKEERQGCRSPKDLVDVSIV